MTGNDVPPLRFLEPGLGFVTAIEAPGAAAGEAASPGTLERARQLALEQPGRIIEDRRAAIADGGNGRQQGLRVRMERTLEQLGVWPRLPPGPPDT